MTDNIFAKDNTSTLNDALFVFELYTSLDDTARDKSIEASTEHEVGTFIVACIRMNSINAEFDIHILRDMSRRYLSIFKGR